MLNPDCTVRESKRSTVDRWACREVERLVVGERGKGVGWGAGSKCRENKETQLKV